MIFSGHSNRQWNSIDNIKKHLIVIQRWSITNSCSCRWFYLNDKIVSCGGRKPWSKTLQGLYRAVTGSPFCPGEEKEDLKLFLVCKCTYCNTCSGSASTFPQSFWSDINNIIMELAPMFVFSILLPLLPLVDGGCSYSQEGKDTSAVFKDMDAARCCSIWYKCS